MHMMMMVESLVFQVWWW